MSLSSNQFVGKLPNCFDSLPNLQSLLIDGNALIGALPKTLLSHGTLNTLRVDNNKFNGSVVVSAPHISSLGLSPTIFQES